MTLSSSSARSAAREPIDRLAEDFVTRLRLGERPALDEYVTMHPELAGDIRELFPILVMMEAAASRTRPPGQAVPATTEIHPLLGEFRLLRELGRGGMGIVYEAEQPRLGRRVALKVLPGPAFASPQQRQRFLREAQAAARLQHAHIVPVFEVGEHEGTLFYAMQLIEGSSLKDVLDGVRTQMPADPDAYVRWIARIGQQAADALDFAHRQGVLHRDVKPSNLLVDSRGDAWVADFGLAKSEGDDDLTGSGDLPGTLRYMAPERLAGWCDPRSDVYGLGLTLYELLTRRPAYDETDRGRLIQRITLEDPLPPRQLNPAIPRDLETIVLKAVVREPAQRYRTAGELHDDLSRFLDGHPVLARRSSPRERLWLWCRRHPGVAALVAVIAALLVVIAGGSLAAAVRLNQQRVAAVENSARATAAEADARRSEREARSAEARSVQARRLADHSLHDALLARGELGRDSRRSGRRFGGLEALAQAASIAEQLRLGAEPRLRLRNAALACMALPDVRVARDWPINLTGWNRRISFDADLERYACGTESGQVVVYQTADGRELFRLPGPGAPALRMRFSPDGAWLGILYGRGTDHSACVWNLTSREPVRQWPRVNPGTVLEFRPDSRVVGLTMRDHVVRFYELPSGRELKHVKPDVSPRWIRFSPDGARVAISRPGSARVQILDYETGDVTLDIEHSRSVWDVCWSPNGGRLATSAEDHLIRVWDSISGQQIQVLSGHKGTAVSLAFSRTGDLLASYGWDGTVRLWNVRSGREQVRLPSSSAELHFSRDDRRLGVLTPRLRVGLLEVAGGTECRRLDGHPGGGVSGLAFSPDERLLVSAGPDSGGLQFWNPATGQHLAQVPNMALSVAFSPDGRTLLTCGRDGIHTWDIDWSGERGLVRVGPPREIDARSWENGAVDPSLKWLATTTPGRNEAVVFDLEQSLPMRTFGAHLGLKYAAWSPDGRQLATGAWHGPDVCIWDVESRRIVCTLQQVPDTRVAFSPDGRWLVTGGQRHVTSRGEYLIWDTSTWSIHRRIPCEATRTPVGSASFSADGSLLALQHSTQQITLVDAAAGEELARLTPPEDIGLTIVAVSPHGSWVAGGTNVGPLYVWNVRRLRGQLAAMGLDWEPVSSGSAGDGEPVEEFAVEVLSAAVE